MSKKVLIYFLVFIFTSCIVTHRVREIKTSELKQPKSDLEYISFNFSSDVRKEKAKDWFRNYFNLDRENDLVNFKIPLLENSDCEFILSIKDYSDREQYIDLTDFFTEDEGETQEKSIQFFIGITVTDKSGEDHLAEDFIFYKAVLAKLKSMRKDFKTFTEKNPDQKFFYAQ